MSKDRDFNTMRTEVLGPNRLYGESEARSLFNADNFTPPPVKVTMKDLVEYRVAFVQLVESRCHVTDALRAYYEYLLGPDRDLRAFQETIRHGKELLLYVTRYHHHLLGSLPIDTVMNLLFADWIVNNPDKAFREQFKTVAVCNYAELYQKYVDEMEQDKLAYPDRYTL